MDSGDPWVWIPHEGVLRRAWAWEDHMDQPRSGSREGGGE